VWTSTGTPYLRRAHAAELSRAHGLRGPPCGS
jgi:hypothetical protein